MRPHHNEDDTAWPEVDLYARKSKVLSKGDRLREVSTDEQLRQGRAWAARNRYRVRKEWVELGSAYAERERPEFNGAVNAVVNGEVPALWAYMIDRFSRRGAEDVLKVIGKARVIFDYDDLDSSKERDRERIILEAERARASSHRLSLRVRDVKQAQRDAGEWLGGTPPWGIAVDPKTRKTGPDPQPAGGTCFRTRGEMGALAVQWLKEGVSARHIVETLNAMGVRSSQGRRLYASTLIQAISSPAYIGLQPGPRGASRSEPYRNARGETVSVGEPLVSPEDQRAALDALAARNITRRTTSKTTTDTRTKHLVTGLSTCEGCGRPASCTGQDYKCGSLTAGDKACPEPVIVSKEALEKYIAQQWLNVVTALEPTDTLALIIAERWAALKAPKETSEHLEAKAVLTAAETVRERLQRAYRAGAYEGADELFVTEMRAATAEVQAAKAELAKHEAPIPDLGFIDDPEVIRKAWKTAEPPMRRALLRLAIDRVTTRKADKPGGPFRGDDRVVITWADHADTEITAEDAERLAASPEHLPGM